jgi:CubicO group peptidase (beta-lactamase class C family)
MKTSFLQGSFGFTIRDNIGNEYLDFKIPSTYAQPITLRNIMTHTPGFEEAIKDLFVARPEDLIPLGRYLSTHMPARIFPPGTTPAYSNYATALAGYIV